MFDVDEDHSRLLAIALYAAYLLLAAILLAAIAS